ncbi:cysteine proteinase inhibitor B [Senna tora]|uniref:Cysteine proteinase inhibitor B n=1 Tax=Senna tora TaxID=362788 RepID=A0A834SP20_9FABA|nr:cysteine proteinase inhibitor B [Senna tora]
MALMISSPSVTLAIFVTVLLGLCTASFGSRGGRSIVGAWTDIGHVEANEEVQELGRYSVEEYNKEERASRRNDVVVGEKVGFAKVVEAKKQVVSGIKYCLKIWGTTRNGGYEMFDSVVVVKPWLHNSKQLLSFSTSRAAKHEQSSRAAEQVQVR